MELEYDIVQFDGIPDNDYVDVKILEDFIADSDIVLSSYGVAWSKDFIEQVGDSFRGATLKFKDGTMTYGYNIKCKLVVKRS